MRHKSWAVVEHPEITKGHLMFGFSPRLAYVIVVSPTSIKVYTGMNEHGLEEQVLCYPGIFL